MPPGRKKKDEVDDTEKASPDSTNRKKQTHLRCERQRREAINSGYQELKELLPSSLSAMGCKTTNASVLFRACDYIRQLQGEDDKNEEELTRLKSQLAALQIICQQYEQLSSNEQSASGASGGGNPGSQWNGPPGPAEIKYNMFRALLDEWFETFDTQVITDDYGSLAKSLLLWLEQGIDFEAVPHIMTEAALGRR